MSPSWRITLGANHILYNKPIVKIITWKSLLRIHSFSWETHKHWIHALFITVLLLWYCYYPTRSTQNPWAVPREKMLSAKSVSPAENDTHFPWMTTWNKWWNKKCGTKEHESQKRSNDYIAFRFIIQETSQLPKQSQYAIFSFILFCMYLFEFIQTHYKPWGQRGKN